MLLLSLCYVVEYDIVLEFVVLCSVAAIKYKIPMVKAILIFSAS